MQESTSLRSLRIIALSFIPVMVGGTIAVGFLHQGWEETDGAMARTGGWIAGALGVIGIVAAIVWSSRVTSRPVSAASLTTSFFVTIAIAESGMLAGFVLTFVSQGGRPFFVGLGLFAIALTIVLVSLSQVEIEADGTSAELIR